MPAQNCNWPPGCGHPTHDPSGRCPQHRGRVVPGGTARSGAGGGISATPPSVSATATAERAHTRAHSIVDAERVQREQNPGSPGTPWSPHLTVHGGTSSGPEASAIVPRMELRDWNAYQRQRGLVDNGTTELTPDDLEEAGIERGDDHVILWGDDLFDLTEEMAGAGESNHVVVLEDHPERGIKFGMAGRARG